MAVINGWQRKAGGATDVGALEMTYLMRFGMGVQSNPGSDTSGKHFFAIILSLFTGLKILFMVTSACNESIRNLVEGKFWGYKGKVLC